MQVCNKYWNICYKFYMVGNKNKFIYCSSSIARNKYRDRM